MKNFLLLIFFLLFISVLFMWDHELTSFWLNSENRNFLLRELFMWGDQYSFILDTLQTYKYPISIIGICYFVYVFYRKWKKKKQKREKENLFHGAKVISDANAILSPESLPESEKKREKKLKEGPSLIKKSEVKKEEPVEAQSDDLDTETMRKILDSK